MRVLAYNGVSVCTMYEMKEVSISIIIFLYYISIILYYYIYYILI